MTIDHETDLLALMMAWIEARPFGRAASSDVSEVPALLQTTITTIEPYRSQAMADACLFLTLPKPIGLGLTAYLTDPIVIAPFGQWPLSISQMRIRLRWSESMSDSFNDSADELLQQVALEQGRWVIVQFWDEAMRQQSREQIRLDRHIRDMLGPA